MYLSGRVATCKCMTKDWNFQVFILSWVDYFMNVVSHSFFFAALNLHILYVNLGFVVWIVYDVN